MRCADPVLGMFAAKRGVAVAGWRDRTGDHPLSLAITSDGGAELFDDADRLMADGQPSAHRVLALEDMDVGAADGRCGDAHKRIQGTNLGHRLVVEHDSARNPRKVVTGKRVSVRVNFGGGRIFKKQNK